MKKSTILLSFAVLSVLSSCGQKSSNDEGAEPDPVANPVETEAPNTSYKPAFDG